MSSSKRHMLRKRLKSGLGNLMSFLLLAKTEPQLAYAAYIFGLFKRWMYLMRTMEDIAHPYQPLEDCIKNVFLPSSVQLQ